MIKQRFFELLKTDSELQLKVKSELEKLGVIRPESEDSVKVPNRRIKSETVAFSDLEEATERKEGKERT